MYRNDMALATQTDHEIRLRNQLIFPCSPGPSGGTDSGVFSSRRASLDQHSSGGCNMGGNISETFRSSNPIGALTTPAGDAENMKPYTSTVALNRSDALSSIVASLGSSSDFSAFSSNSFNSGVPFGMVEVVTITASQSDTITGTFGRSRPSSSAPEPATFGTAAIAGLALIEGEAFARKKFVSNES